MSRLRDKSRGFYTMFKNDDLKHVMLFIKNKGDRDYSDWIATEYYFSKFRV